jgi:hypothetical protein
MVKQNKRCSKIFFHFIVYRIQNTEYRIQNTEYRIQNTELTYNLEVQKLSLQFAKVEFISDAVGSSSAGKHNQFLNLVHIEFPI